jgi:hypothetical protein
MIGMAAIMRDVTRRFDETLAEHVARHPEDVGRTVGTSTGY